MNVLFWLCQVILYFLETANGFAVMNLNFSLTATIYLALSIDSASDRQNVAFFNGSLVASFWIW